MAQNTDASLTYAALECRLAIERICYERLRLAHDYISHDDLKKWQPRDIVNILIREVDDKTAETLTLSVAKEPVPKNSAKPTLEDYQAMEFLPIGTQIGFNPNRLGRLWNALANLALHITLPTSKDHEVARYGNTEKVRAKVIEALDEIKRIGAGTLILSGIGEEVSFNCFCGVKNKRRYGLLKDGQIISCISSKCDETYGYVASNMSFGRRVCEIICRSCGGQRDLPKKMVERLRTDQHIHFDCEGCSERINISWRLMQRQGSKPSE